MQGIFWITTYAKSGSNWFRMFLDNLIENGKEPVDIFRSPHVYDYKNRKILDLHSGIESANLSDEEVDELRSQLYEHLARHEEKPLFVKVHCAYRTLPSGRKIVPERVSRGAIYLIRNPLDIAASFASHFGTCIDEAIAFMASEDAAFDAGNGHFHIHLGQKLLSWSHHVKSWTEMNDFPVHVMRYEDMLQNPFDCFTKAVEFAGLEVGRERVLRALRHSAFDEVKKREAAAGNSYMNVGSGSFFRSGKKGGWQCELSTKQVERIINVHGAVMRAFGYINEKNEPIV